MPKKPSISGSSISPRKAKHAGAAALFAPQPSFEKVVLLSLTGESPAILTETLWALAFPPSGVAPVIPERVVVITTSRGRDEFSRQLDTKLPEFGNRTAWEALCTEIRTAHPNLNPPPALPMVRIITGRSSDGSREVELSDIRTPADNDAAADFILESVRGLSENEDHRLIVSLAGGRKTMVALLYASMSLIGRETARITHVLVNPPFDMRLDPPFFFPPKSPINHKYSNRNTRQEEIWSSEKARIELADVPFVPMRNAFAEIGKVPGGFRGLVARYGAAFRKRADYIPTLQLDESRPALLVDGKAVGFPASVGNPTAQTLVVATLLAVQPHLPPTGRFGKVDQFAEIVKAHHGAAFSLDGNDQRTAKEVAQKLSSKAQTAGGNDYARQINARFVTRTLSQLRTELHGKLGLSEWLKGRGSLKLGAHRIAR